MKPGGVTTQEIGDRGEPRVVSRPRAQLAPARGSADETRSNSYTFLNTNPALNCTWSDGLAPSRLSNPFGSRRLSSAPTAGLIVTNPWHQPAGRMSVSD